VTFGLVLTVAASREQAIAANRPLPVALNGERRRITAESGPTIGTTVSIGPGDKRHRRRHSQRDEQPLIGGSIPGTGPARIGQPTGAEAGGIAGRAATAANSTNAGHPVQIGVIMDVTPHVNSGGLVTLDIAQEVNDVGSAVTTTGLNSPTFNERRVVPRVAVQDGQIVGLAGLIQDNVSNSNGGVAWFKDIPILSFFVSQQNNQRTKTELLVLITPHMVHDQRDARALPEDLREQLPGAAAVPDESTNLPSSGSPDPMLTLRRRLRLQ